MSIFKSVIKSCIFLVFLSSYIYCTDSTGTKKDEWKYVDLDVSINKTVKVNKTVKEKKTKKTKTVTTEYKLALYLYKTEFDDKKKKRSRTL